MSEREQLQNTIVEYLENNPRWTAPYGVLAGLSKLPNGPGKFRTVTFGVARYLDATIYIWSPTKLTVRAQGGLSPKIDGGTWHSWEELKNDLDNL